MSPFDWISKHILSALTNTTDVKKGDALVGFKQPLPGAVPRTVHDKLTEWVSVKDFGAAGDGVTDDAAAIQAAADSFGDLGGAVFFPAGVYEVRSEIRISHIRVSLQGAGRYATLVNFSPAQDHQTLFKFDRGSAGVLWQCSIRDMALVSSLDTGLTKTAIELHDTSNMIVEDIIISPWTGKGDSAGLRLRGREAGHIDNLHIHADRPLVIERNDANLFNALDHFNFNDLYLLVTQGVKQPCIFIDEGVQLQNIAFGGFQAWVLGTYGLYWRDTTTTGASLALTLKNVRTEQNTNPEGYSVYIEQNAHLQDLLIENMVSDNNQRGFFFRNMERVTLRHVNYNGSGVALDVDNVSELFLDQVYVGPNAAAVMPNMQEKIAFNRAQTHSPVPDTAYFVKAVETWPAQALHLFGGTKVWTFSGALADDELLTIPAGDNEGRRAALIFVSACNSGKKISEGGQVMDTAIHPDNPVEPSNGIIRLAGTPNFDVGNKDGKLTVFHTGSTAVFNRLGHPVELVVFVVWT